MGERGEGTLDEANKHGLIEKGNKQVVAVTTDTV